MFAIFFFGLEIFLAWRLDPEVQAFQSLQKRLLTHWQQDAHVVQNWPLTPNPSSYTSDASTYLTPLIDWKNTDEIREPAHLKLPQHLLERLTKYGSRWLEKNGDFQLQEVQFGIFSELGNYDHWNLVRSEQGPVQENLLPRPDPVPFTQIAQLRLIQGYQLRQPLEALRDVHQMAKILMTTQDFLLEIAGLRILSHEITASRFYTEKGLIEPEAWSAPSMELVQASYRYLWLMKNFWNPLTPEDVQKKVFKIAQGQWGFCATLKEVIQPQQRMRRYLEPTWPFEREYEDWFQPMDQILGDASENCRSGQDIRWLLNAHRDLDIDWDRPLGQLPYLRRAQGLRLGLLPAPDSHNPQL